MKKIFKLSLVIALAFSSVFSYGQILNPRRIGKKVADRAAQRAEQRAEQKANESIDKGVDKVFDSIFNSGNKTTESKPQTETKANTPTPTNSSSAEMSQEQAMGMLSGMLGGMGSTPPPSDSYSFSSSYVMDIKTKNSEGDFNMKNKYYFTQSGNYMGSKMISGSSPGMTGDTHGLQAIIIDFDKDCMYTFMEAEGKKNMIGMSMKAAGNMAAKMAEEQNEATTFTKTGETKTISGYTCDAYLLTQGKDKNTIWISRSRVPVVSAYYKSFQKMASSGSTSLFNIDNTANAEMMKFATEGRAMLGMNSLSEDGEQIAMEVTDIKESDNYTIQTAGYENMMDFNKIMQDAQRQQESSED
ncbi:DUF4412 domain-containing protein [uncultured Arcticibacterium sp.]|uniref:DUF4412 domain-containing protein n=1 Tax=uncultured Arcticibacterium sp. TaxID=2173042 RepID=UPI0030F6CF75